MRRDASARKAFPHLHCSSRSVCGAAVPPLGEAFGCLALSGADQVPRHRSLPQWEPRGLAAARAALDKMVEITNSGASGTVSNSIITSTALDDVDAS